MLFLLCITFIFITIICLPLLYCIDYEFFPYLTFPHIYSQIPISQHENLFPKSILLLLHEITLYKALLRDRLKNFAIEVRHSEA